MRCPNCGRENPDIRLFCSRCGELLPEKDAPAAQEAPPAAAAPDFEDDVRIYRRPERRDAADTAVEKSENMIAEADEMRKPVSTTAHTKTREPREPANAAAYTETREPHEPANAAAQEETLSDTSDTDFYRMRQRSRRVIEEAWPETSEAAQPKRQSLFDGARERPRTESGNAYARPERISEPARPVLNRREVVDAGRASTVIPKRDDTMDPDDFFAVRGQVMPEYAERRKERTARRAGKGDAFEDSAPQSFAVRHMRGIVTLVLLAVTLAIVFIWANTDGAQRTLAQVDLAWKAEAYAQLGQEYYAAGDLSAAGYCYSRALERDGDNANYAISAANAYIEGGYTSKALEALRECIAIIPENADLYVKLMEMQSGYENMSEADRQLVDRGYAITGDDRLNKK